MGLGLNIDRDASLRPLVSEEEFDAIVGRLTKAGRNYTADPLHKEAGKLNSNQEGRGLYIQELNGHTLELLTRA